MEGNYWLVEIERPHGPEFGCVYALSVRDALKDARRLFGEDSVTKELEALSIKWFHYEPIVAASRNVMEMSVVSLREQFFSGGKIGCEINGFEIIFTPDLLHEPEERGEGDDAMTVYGNALAQG